MDFRKTSDGNTQHATTHTDDVPQPLPHTLLVSDLRFFRFFAVLVHHGAGAGGGGARTAEHSAGSRQTRRRTPPGEAEDGSSGAGGLGWRDPQTATGVTEEGESGHLWSGGGLLLSLRRYTVDNASSGPGEEEDRAAATGSTADHSVSVMRKVPRGRACAFTWGNFRKELLLGL